MTFSRQTRVLLALGSGIALAFSFPNYNLPLLAWISIGMLVLASIGAPPREAPLYGFLHAFVFYPICLPWIATVMRQYGNVDPWISAGILGLFGIAGGIIWSTFSMSVAFVARRRGIALACVLAPFFWVTLEFARTHLPIHWLPVESHRLRREQQSRASATDTHHRHLGPLLRDCRIRLTSRLCSPYARTAAPGNPSSS